MNTQSRGAPNPGYHPSPPQLIPKYTGNTGAGQHQVSYNSPQAYSPRHITPSSPHHHQQQIAYYTSNVPNVTHDMNKSQGVGSAPMHSMMMEDSGSRDGMSLRYYPNPTYFWPSCPTLRASPPGVVGVQPPRQQQHFFQQQNGHRPRQQMQNQYFYPGYANPQTRPQSTPPFYNAGTFQYLPQINPAAPQTHLPYNPPYGPQYQATPPQPTHMNPPPMVSPAIPQPSSEKRAKKIITIRDPNTNVDMTDDILKGATKARQESTPPSGRSSATPPNSEIASKFAAQVMARAQSTVGPTKSAPVAAEGQQGISPAPLNTIDQQGMNTGSQMMPPFSMETAIVGSPNLGATVVRPHVSQSPKSYMALPSQHSSPSVNPYSVPPPSYPVVTGTVVLSSSPVMAQPPVHPQQYQSFEPPVQMQPVMAPNKQFAGDMSTPSMQGHSHGSQNRPVAVPYQDHGKMQVQQQPGIPPFRPQQTSGSAHVVPAVQQSVIDKPISILQHASPTQQTSDASKTKNDEISAPAAKPQNTETEASSTVTTEGAETVKRDATKDEVVKDPKSNSASQTSGRSKSQEILKKGDTVQVTKSGSDTGAGVSTTASSEKKQKVPVTTHPVPMSYASKASAKPVEAAKMPVSKAGPVAAATLIKTDVPASPAEPAQSLEKEDTAIRLGARSPEIADDSGKSDGVGVPEQRKEDLQSESTSTKSLDGSKDVNDETPPDPTAADPQAVEVAVETPSTPKQTQPEINIVPATPETKVTAAEQTAVADPPKVESKETEAKAETTSTPAPPVKISTPSDKRKTAKAEQQTPQNVVPKLVGKPTKKDMPDSKANSQSKVPSSSTIASKKATSDDQPDTVPNGTATGSPVSEGSQSKAPPSKPDVQSTATVSSKEQEVKSQSKPANTKDEKKPTKVAENKQTKSSSTEKSNGEVKAVTDVKYEGDQWSPSNPKGKRQYDSNFLLQFQFKPSAMEKPKDLPNIDIVLDTPHKTSNPMPPFEYRTGAGSDMLPPFMRTGEMRAGRQTSQGHRRRPDGRQGMSGPNISNQKVKVVSISREEVELKRAEHAWKPIKHDPALSGRGKETQEVIRDVRAILNKLTPSKFGELMKQVLALKIDTEEKLRGAIDLVFEKAIDEPNFSETYANMCRHMTSIRVTAEARADVEFRKLLLTKCQKEFEKNKSDQEHILELKKKLEKNDDPKLAPQLKEDYEVAESKERRRTLGNIRFIGELFKLKMLTESIMHNCIMSLFKAKDDDHLESLCRLLTTIGKDLDHVKGKSRMDQYFDQMVKIIKEKKTTSRVRFMLQDVCELRQNNWIPRAITVQGPKTISQIHQDAKEEHDMLQLKIATTPTIPPVKQGSRPGNRMGSRGNGGEDGWTRVQTSQKTIRYDPSKMKLRSNQMDHNNITLGPSGAYTGWKSGSGSASSASRTGSTGYSPSSSMDKSSDSGRSSTPTNMMNRFSALSGQQQGQGGSDQEYQRSSGGRQSSREGSRSGSRGSMGPPSGSRTPRKDERSSLLETTRKMTSADRNMNARQRSRESSPSLGPRPPTPQAAPHKYNMEMSSEKMKAKSSAILSEFLSIVDFKEATECLEELNAPPSVLHLFVTEAHESTLEKNRTSRSNIGKLLAHLLKLGRISTQHYIKGLSEFLECAADLEIDIPKVWEYVAEQMCPVLIAEGTELRLSCLQNLAAPLLELEKSGIFVAEVLKQLLKHMSVNQLAAQWQFANLRWSKILDTNDNKIIQDFLIQHNLERITATKGKVENDEERYYAALRDLLKKNLEHDDIFNWVEEKVPAAERSKPAFLRALTTSVCRNAIRGTAELTVCRDTLGKHILLLRKFLENDSAKELQALYALQRLMVLLEQPANVLKSLFQILYDEDVISENTFVKWETSTDPDEQEGKGVTLASAKPFLTWLKIAECESD